MVLSLPHIVVNLLLARLDVDTTITTTYWAVIANYRLAAEITSKKFN